MSGTRISLLAVALLALSSCSVETYGIADVTESDFVSALASEDYLPSTSVHSAPSVAGGLSDVATAVSAFPFVEMGSRANRSVNFYRDGSYSLPYGGQTVSGTYDEDNGLYFLLIGTNKGLVYGERDMVDRYREEAVALYQSDYDACYANYEILEALALDKLAGVSKDDFSHYDLEVANIASTVGYHLTIQKDGENGAYRYLELNITMDYIEEEQSYAITDYSYRLTDVSVDRSGTYRTAYYVNEFKFGSANDMSDFAVSWPSYTLSMVESGIGAVTPDDLFGAAGA